MALAHIESADPTNLPLAKEMCETLHLTYPNHSWSVRIDGGIVFIRHFGISGTIGMARKFKSLSYDAHARKVDVIRAAGELLERAGLKRGARRDEKVERLEGGEAFGWAKPRNAVLPFGVVR